MGLCNCSHEERGGKVGSPGEPTKALPPSSTAAFSLLHFQRYKRYVFHYSFHVKSVL